MKKLLTLLLIIAANTYSHQFWVDPEQFLVSPNGTVKIRLFVGHLFEGEAYSYNPFHIEKFLIHNGKQSMPIYSKPGQDPAGIIRLPRDGMYIISYRSKRTLNLMEAIPFSEYLKKEGLEKIIDERIARQEESKQGKEYFSRCAKSIIRCGNNSSSCHDLVVGFPLELIPEKNPYDFDLNEDFVIELLHNGYPLEGALVVAANRKNPKNMITQRTDKDGKAKLALKESGDWAIETVHMIRIQEASADWESFWASLTFAIPPTNQKE